MTDALTESQGKVATRHRATTLARVAGRTRRVLGTAALVFTTAAVIVVPLTGSADAAPNGAHASATTAATAMVVRTGDRLTQATYETRLRTWINRVRHEHGIRPIAVRPCHDGFAERWTGYLARNDQFRHQDLGRYMSRCKLSKAGEILALGSVTPRKMVQMWMHSSGHRAIMLDRSFGLSGIAAKRDTHGYWVGCVDFGRRMG